MDEFYFSFWLCWVFLTLCGILYCCGGGGGEWGLLFAIVSGLLIVVVSLISEHRL